ncbi:MAG: glycoside hydrolase family 127 protein [Chitinophagaceae bacterium]|nr:glycoside hydrolase family 127 protein [Chitinophagaceae bacterium]MCW5927175.1 glycoside hydrolase family 127 protein [Chitinophagaceae bacterium]
MKKGLTGNLDVYYPQVVGQRNAWLGGDGDAWERGPYWIDGLLPLAYILKDKALIEKVQPWIEWTLNNQREDGYMGPPVLSEKPATEFGLQKEPREDWWPRMVMLKVLQQYYQATADERVVSFLTRYFRYQLNQLPQKPVDHWSFWGNKRAADNLMVVYWLYNITGEAFLLDLGNLLYKQAFPFTAVFLNDYTRRVDGTDHLYPQNAANKYPYRQDLVDRLHVGQWQSFHCVNLAQGIKTPVIYYQQEHDPGYLAAVRKAFNDIDFFHGQAQGMYGGDEALHGASPTQGVEFCSVVEMMFSLESMLPVTADVSMADRLEKIAFNALPTQATDDFMYRQYFQTANQVLITRATRNFFEEESHKGTDLCFGLLTGYPCCTANMHQGWPKFVQNLWYSTPDNGVAALVYGPSSVNVKVGDGTMVKITEETNYPFDETIRFIIETPKALEFPFHLRIPAWADKPVIKVNGQQWDVNMKPGAILQLNGIWKNGDLIELSLPMKIRISRWESSSAAVERGPLVYALKIEEEWKKVEATDHFGPYYEVYPKSPWNYGLLKGAVNDPEKGFEVIKGNAGSGYPWTAATAPVLIKTKARRIPSWQLYNNAAGPLPNTMMPVEVEETVPVTLIPYGSSTLRIAQFPVVK